MWSRTAEKTNKLAILFACSRSDAFAPVIEVEDIDRAIKLSNWLTRKMLTQAGVYVTENEWEKKKKKVMRLNENGLTKSELTRKTQWLTRREREEIIDELVNAGHWLAVDEETATKPLKKYFKNSSN